MSRTGIVLEEEFILHNKKGHKQNTTTTTTVSGHMYTVARGRGIFVVILIMRR